MRRQWNSSTAYVVVYLVAIVAANLTIAAFGPAWSVVNAFAFIGLDLTARDHLHDAWHGRRLWLKMFCLVLAGSALSALLSASALRIAVASAIAFGAAGLTDAVTYHILRERARLLRVNGSNVVSALIDSIVFPAAAFGFPLLVPVMAGQFVAKVTGGAIWSVILAAVDKQHTHAPAS